MDDFWLDIAKNRDNNDPSAKIIQNPCPDKITFPSQKTFSTNLMKDSTSSNLHLNKLPSNQGTTTNISTGKQNHIKDYLNMHEKDHNFRVKRMFHTRTSCVLNPIKN